MSEICKLCMYTDIKIKQFPCNACDDAFSMFKSGIEQQLQKAHRAGWEQAKREAVGIVKKYACDEWNCRDVVSDYIVAMEYGGKAND